MLMHAENHPNNTSSQFLAEMIFHPTDRTVVSDAALLLMPLRYNGNMQTQTTQMLRYNPIYEATTKNLISIAHTHSNTKKNTIARSKMSAHARECVCAREREKDLSGGKICEYKKKE